MPEFKVSSALGEYRWAWVNKHHFNSQGNSLAKLAFSALLPILCVIKIELVDRGTSAQTIRTQYQIKRFANGALADVVGAHKQCVAVKLQLCAFDASKV